MYVCVAVNRNYHLLLHTERSVLDITGGFITRWQQHQKGYEFCLFMKFNYEVVYDQTIMEQNCHSQAAWTNTSE